MDNTGLHLLASRLSVVLSPCLGPEGRGMLC